MSDNTQANLIAIVLLVLYFLPTIIAVVRIAKRTAGIAILNLLLGWTVLGWIGALIWAVSDNTRPKPSARQPSIDEFLDAANHNGKGPKQ